MLEISIFNNLICFTSGINPPVCLKRFFLFHPPETGNITQRNYNRLREFTEEYHCIYLNELSMNIYLILHFNSRLEQVFFWNVFDDFKLLYGYNKLKTKNMLSQIYLGVHAMEEETVAM